MIFHLFSVYIFFLFCDLWKKGIKRGGHRLQAAFKSTYSKAWCYFFVVRMKSNISPLPTSSASYSRLGIRWNLKNDVIKSALVSLILLHHSAMKMIKYFWFNKFLFVFHPPHSVRAIWQLFFCCCCWSNSSSECGVVKSRKFFFSTKTKRF